MKKILIGLFMLMAFFVFASDKYIDVKTEFNKEYSAYILFITNISDKPVVITKIHVEGDNLYEKSVGDFTYGKVVIPVGMCVLWEKPIWQYDLEQKSKCNITVYRKEATDEDIKNADKGQEDDFAIVSDNVAEEK
ncbi:MAG: hypothetical protein ABSG25_01620 [Bryobacteraceae bacterium]